ncbi:MAG: hypothetical protein ACXVEF_38845 [Polyangiales bacterium]
MGGTYDETTGRTIWEFRVPLDEQLAFYGAHPPRGLDGFRATPIRLPDWQFDGHGEPVNAIFELTCECGNAGFVALGYQRARGYGPPIALDCVSCDVRRIVFDATRDGWDAQTNPARRQSELFATGFWGKATPPFAIQARKISSNLFRFATTG